MTSIGNISTSGNAAYYRVAQTQATAVARQKPKDEQTPTATSSTSSTSSTQEVAADAVAEKIAAEQGTPPPPPGGPRGENAGLREPAKLQQVSDLLDMDTKDVTEAATSASSLVSMLQGRGVDLTQLKDVLNRSGDLLDVNA